jgi:tetratricopeptide (TPR) repeat protein
MQMGDLDAARAAVVQALGAARACGDAWTVARALNAQAAIEQDVSGIAAAREGYAQALAAFKALGNDVGIATVLSNLGELEFTDGHPERALAMNTEMLEILLRGKNASHIATGYVNGAAYRLALGDLAGARESLHEGLRVGRKARDEAQIATLLQHLGLLAGLSGDSRRAAQLLGHVDRRFAEMGSKREPTERWGYDKLLAALRDAMDEDEVARLSAEGATWSEDRAIEEALLIEILPHVKVK